MKLRNDDVNDKVYDPGFLLPMFVNVLGSGMCYKIIFYTFRYI